MGPLITRASRQGRLVPQLRRGARRDPRRRRPRDRARRRRLLLGVSLLDNVTTEERTRTDQIFGPVLSVVRVKTYDEAVGLVNDNPYGNGVALFTRDGAARQFQFDVSAGMVGINVLIPVPRAYSFGGWKASLVRRLARLRA